MAELIDFNEGIIQIILQAFGYGLFTGLVFFLVFWGVKHVVSILRT